ncbi:unnamed protein product [Schistosoma spindalis]|nr:unnamed protein product [Schistosoma spindale]
MKLVYSNHQSIIGIINHDTDEPFLQIDHYYYIESIRFNQSSPVIFDSMKKSIILSRPWTFMPLFPIIYYGEAFRLVTIFSQDEFSAIKWLRLNTQYSNEYQLKDYGILFNVKISYSLWLYFIEIPNEIETNSSVKLIYEPPNEGCMEYKFCEDCTKNYTFGRKCHWCPQFNTCRHLRDIDIQTLLGKDCAVQQIGLCSTSTKISTEHITTEESTVKHNTESTNLITLTSDRNTMESITTEDISPTQLLINTDEFDKISESSINDHQTTLPQITLYHSSSRPIQTTTTTTTNMITKVNEDNPITSKQLLLSRDILQIYSITFINEVSRRLYIRLLMPFIIVIIVSSILFLVWLFRIHHRNDIKKPIFISYN